MTGHSLGTNFQEYTGGVRTVEWHPEKTAATQLRSWSELAAKPGIVHALFVDDVGGSSPGWESIEPWTRSRAVTVAEVRSSLSSAALDVALCSDIVYIHRGVELILPEGEPSAGLLWALGRAGRAALARGLLDSRPIAEDEAVGLGLAQRVLDIGESPLVSESSSFVALSTARDLMRSSASARSTLELAAFRLLFASGDPGEGARAFFEQRVPEFTD